VLPKWPTDSGVGLRASASLLLIGHL